jgi:HEAT repeat protein
MMATLVEVLSDDAVRLASAKALSCFGESAVPALVVAFESQDAKVRQASALGIMHIGEPAAKARPALVSLLKDGDRDVRRAAAQALEAVGADAAEAVPALAKVIDSNDAEPVRAAAVKALVRAEPDAKSAVVAAFLGQIRENNSYGIRMLCEWGLKTVDPAAAERANIP